MYDYFFPRAKVFNLAAPGANTNILGTSLTPLRPQGTMRVTVCLAVGSVFNVIATHGTTNLTLSLNGGAALAAGALYVFTFGCNSDTTYNFQVATNGIVNYMQVEESNLGAF